MTTIPKVLRVRSAGDYKIYAYFNDGSIHLYDMAPSIEKGGVFERIHDKAVFDSTLTVMNGTIAWDLTGDHDPKQCIDIDPLVVYASPAVR